MQRPNRNISYTEYSRVYDPPVDKPEPLRSPFNTTICTFVKRLGDNEYQLQLKNGRSLSFVKSDQASELYTKSGRPRNQSSYVNRYRISINHEIALAGESNDALYFYSATSIPGDKQKYSLYISQHLPEDQINFENIREVIFHATPHFAIQQPYFLSEDGKSVESFTGWRKNLSASISKSQGFFIWRLTVFIVTTETGVHSPKAEFIDGIVSVALPESMTIPHSLYAELEEFAYLLCHDKLLIIEEDLSIVVIDIDGFDTLDTSISGVGEGQLIVNIIDSECQPTYDMVLSLNVKKCIQDSLGVDGPTSITNPCKDIERQQTSHLNHLHNDEVADLTQAIQLSMEAEILRLKQEVTKLMDEKNQQNEEISRLQQTQKTLMESTRIMSIQHSHNSYDTLGPLTPKFSHEFDIHNVIGVGSFGIVFEAVNIYDYGRYAVKRIAVESNEKTVDKALREVRTMAQLDHPGIVRYNSTWIEKPPAGWQEDADEATLRKFRTSSLEMPRYPREPMFIYIQMQLCEYSLSEWLKRQDVTPRNIPRIISWFKQIASAVAYIHAKGLIHRDLKPSNILFVESDRLKICDLGIAAQRTVNGEAEVTSTLTNTGTPLYMAPEQSGWQYNSKVDVYSLGLIMTELCAVMANNERKQIFANFRCGIPCSKLHDQPRISSFVAWLTQLDHRKRPTCNEVINHALLN